MTLLALRLQFSATARAPRCARLFVRQALEAWLLHDLVQSAELIVSELVTNAVKATGNPEPLLTRAEVEAAGLVAVQVRVEAGALFVEVWDNDSDEPRLELSDDELRESGRGLAIIAELSDEFGAARSYYGKVVWARLEVGDAMAWVSLGEQPVLFPKVSTRVRLPERRHLRDHFRADFALMERIERVFWESRSS